MTAAAFDTLKFARSLREKAKLTPEQAEGFADAMAEAFQGDVATKGDVLAVRADIEALRVSAKSDVQAIKADLRETELRLEAKIETVKADIIKWMFGTIGFQTLIILGAVIALARVIRP